MFVPGSIPLGMTALQEPPSPVGEAIEKGARRRVGRVPTAAWMIIPQLRGHDMGMGQVTNQPKNGCAGVQGPALTHSHVLGNYGYNYYSSSESWYFIPGLLDSHLDSQLQSWQKRPVRMVHQLKIAGG